MDLTFILDGKLVFPISRSNQIDSPPSGLTPMPPTDALIYRVRPGSLRKSAYADVKALGSCTRSSQFSAGRSRSALFRLSCSSIDIPGTF